MDEKAPIAHAKVEILEAADLKPSDMNGLADPYVKGHLGPYRFRTKVIKKTLSPKWLEEFKIPITSWEAPNLLVLELRDKDHIFDDMLGDCAINISDLRGGQRHDKWLPLRNIKMGRAHLAITVLEGQQDDKGEQQKSERAGEHQDGDDDNVPKVIETTTPRSNSTVQNQDNEETSMEESHNMVAEFEAINIEGQEKTGIWVHHPGKDVSQSWEPRKGRARRPETKLQCMNNEGSDSPKSVESGSHLSDTTRNDDNGKKVHQLSTIKRGMHKIGSLFHSNSRDENSRQDADEFSVPITPVPTPRPNLRSVGEKETAIRVIYDDSCDVKNTGDQEPYKVSSPEKGEAEKTKRGRVKGIAKNIIKQAGKPAHTLKSVLSRKGSFSPNEEQGLEIEEKEASQGSDSSDALKDCPLVEGSPLQADAPPVHNIGPTEAKQAFQSRPGPEKAAERSAKIEETGREGNLETS